MGCLTSQLIYMREIVTNCLMAVNILSCFVKIKNFDKAWKTVLMYGVLHITYSQQIWAYCQILWLLFEQIQGYEKKGWRWWCYSDNHTKWAVFQRNKTELGSFNSAKASLRAKKFMKLTHLFAQSARGKWKSYLLLMISK